MAALSVVTWPWQSMMAEAGDTTARRYVDDLTAWCRGPPDDCPTAAAAMCSATAIFATRAQLAVSTTKSGVFASTAATRAALVAVDPAAPLLRSFRDPGIQQHAGVLGATAMATRDQTARARLERLAGLPLPHTKRAQAVASAGVSAATYGTAAPHIHVWWSLVHH